MPLLVGLACSGTDETRIKGAEPGTSRTLTVLTDPASVDALCRVLGLSSRAALGGAEACHGFVERCNEAIGWLLGSDDPGAAPAETTNGELADVDLSPLLGCSVTAAQVDACLAGLIERGRDVYGAQVSCDVAALPALDVAEIGIAPGCLTVALRCPELIGLADM